MVLDPAILIPIPRGAWLQSVQTFPIDLMSLVLDEVPACSDTRHGHARRDVVELALSTHTTGDRRPSLASLAGYLRRHGVAEDVAVALLDSWAQEHFSPSLPAHEIERHVRGIYGRYGLGGVGMDPPNPAEIVSMNSAPTEVRDMLEEIWR